MYLSLNWLKELVMVPKNLSAEEIALKMTMHTVEVDSVRKQGEKFKNVVIGKILKITKHSNADMLRIAQVDVGKEVLSIVCGADNICEGQHVPVALAGAVLANGMEIKEVEVRGEKSYGMLCAEDELGIGPDHAGILIIEGRPKPGNNFSDYLKYDDIIIEVDNKSITHRPDLWSHLGIAREMSVFLGTKLSAHSLELLASKPEAPTAKEKNIKVTVGETKLCPRYMAAVIDGIKVGESPEHIKQRLIGVGMRPLNNIVDITNYVMLELGQPLHAFDAGKIGLGGENMEIIVRKSLKGEKIETLDGKIRTLEEGMLLIADINTPLAIAGVMGGEFSEISADTSAIIIESANFEHVCIRQASQKLGLRTEASMRYEKALDPNLCETALARCISLIKQTCPEAKVVGGIADEKNFQLDQGPIMVPFEQIEKSMGIKLDKKWALGILHKLGFEVEKKDGALSIMVPSFRATRDISQPEDIVEEVARIFGYDNIEKRMPDIKMTNIGLDDAVAAKRKIRNLLALGCGLSETNGYSFVSEDQLKKMGIDPVSYIRILNPIASHLALLRQSLAQGMLGAAVKNQAKFDPLGLFEIGQVFLPSPGNLPVDDKADSFLPFQEEKLGFILVGESKPDKLMNKAKGIVGYLAKGFGFNAGFAPAEMWSPWEDANMSGNIMLEGQTAGRIALLAKNTAKNLGIKKNTVIVEMPLKTIIDLAEKSTDKFEEFERFPPAIRDLAFVIDKKILYNDLRQEILSYSQIIKKAELFDVYEGVKIGIKNKSLAFHITYQADKTLTSGEVDNMQEGLIKRLEERFDAKVRDF
jgi:phenylalanyl-tRNA synthetase beta chain